MRRRLLISVVVAALAVPLAVWLALPPRAIAAGGLLDDPRVVRGAIHVHTERSDGTGSVEDVAEAARRAGLQFVIFTDHGDATRPPDPPTYRAGVLCLDAVEISTTGGHYVALGLPRAPYRLAGEPRDVVADVRRLGGIGIVAHPDSPKADLRWGAWDEPFDGLEWLNADSEWRDESPAAVARALTTYLFRGPETIAMLFDRPEASLARWDALNRQRRVIGLAGHDAHARIGLRGNWEPANGDVSIRAPSYEAAFRTFAVRVSLQQPPGGDAAADAAALLEALRAGRAYTAIDALARDGWLTFTATGGDRTATAGDDLATDGPAELVAQASPLPGLTLALLRDGAPLATVPGAELRARHPGGAAVSVYRVEAHVDHGVGRRGMPWMVANAIRIGPAAALAPAAEASPPAVASAPVEGTWRVEHDPASRASLEPVRGELSGRLLAYSLAEGTPRGQYAAAVLLVPRGSLRVWDRVAFDARAGAPMRLSVQLRDPGTGRRWARSVYVPPAPERLLVPFGELVAVDAAGDAPFLHLVDSVLFVVDTTNTAPGSSGALRIGDVRVERTAAATSTSRE